MDGESRRRGSVLLKGVRGIFPEIFEKSIDKHKIDAILNAPSVRNGILWGAVLEVGGCGRRIPRKNPALTIPIQRAKNSPGAFMSLRHGRERCKDFVHFVFGGVL